MLLPTFSTLGAGPTILMLHGAGGDHLAFAPQVETFAGSGYRAVAWDMPGYGHSAPVESYNFKSLAQSCVLLIESLLEGDARGSLTLLGHGMGGMLAQEVVARRPALVNRLILAGTTATGGPADGMGTGTVTDWQRQFASQCALGPGQAMADLAEVLVPRMIGPGALPEGVKLATHCMSRVPPSTWRRALEAQQAFDRRASLPAIHVPTLLIAGEHDRVAPPAAMRGMGEAIAGSTFVELHGIGHLQNLEAPEEFDGVVLNFLAMPRLLH